MPADQPTLFDTVEPEYRCKDCGKDLTGTRFPQYGQCHACNHAEVARFFIGWLDEQTSSRQLTDHQLAEAAVWRRRFQEYLT